LEDILTFRIWKFKWVGHKFGKRKGSVEMDAEDWNSEETKGSKGRERTWFRKRKIEEKALQKVCASLNKV
jgi:hypothetical protein